MNAATTAEAREALKQLDAVGLEMEGAAFWLSGLLGDQRPMPEAVRASIRTSIEAAQKKDK